MIRSGWLALGGFLAATVLMGDPAQATRPGRRHEVVGCVIGGRFVPYAGQALGSHFRGPQKLPHWVGKTGGRKAEAKEIVLKWRAFSADIPHFAPPDGAARWEQQGPCKRDQLTKEPPEPD